MFIPKNKIVVYTCITNSYDILFEPKYVSNNIEYICFIDKNDLIKFKSNVWKCREIPQELLNLSKIKQQRILKICPHKWLSEYDISIWIDANLQIIGNINYLLSLCDLNRYSFYTRKHTNRTCIYSEGYACVKKYKETYLLVNEILTRYRNENYPVNNGLGETGIIIRKHNDTKCKILCNTWATELIKYSARDQLSLNYVCWKTKIDIGYLTNINIRNNNYFKYRRHGKRI